jgi:large subunit ribosomal protein L25
MEQIIVEAAPRSDRGKNAARRLRQTGQVPGVLYGGSGESVALTVNAKQVAGILRSESGHNTIFKVKLGAQQHSAIVKDWQVDPVTGSLLHVDLLRIAMDVRMRIKVPVHTFGEAAGVKQQGGIFEMVTREVEIECLPSEIPTEFRADISALMIGDQLRVSNLPIDLAKMKLVTEPQRVIAHVVALREEEEKPAEVAVVEGAAAVPAEPEVIKKGKKEEEGEEAAEAAEEKPKEKQKK